MSCLTFAKPTKTQKILLWGLSVMNFDKTFLVEVAQKIKNKKLSSKEVCLHCLNIYQQTKELNAFVSVDSEYVLAQADKIDKKIAEGKPVGRLAGVPVGVKDNITTEFYPTTCASNCFKNGLLPKSDATVVKNLKTADAIIFGKTNMDELAMGFSSTNSAFGEVSNPYGTEYSAGGSSGGSAVSVAVGSVFGALGTDTGGSIRQPASNCGVVGLKPTFDSVSRNGVFPLSKTLDHVGCMAQNVRDCAEMFSVINANGKDFSRCFAPQKPTLKVVYLADFEGAFIDDDVKRAYFDAVAVLKQIGYKLEGIKFGFSKRIAETYQVLCCTEGVESFDDFNQLYPDTITTQKCGKEVNKRVAFGKSVLSNNPDAVKDAFIIMESTKQYVATVLAECDVILSPTTLMRALKKHEEVSNEKGFTSDLFSIVCNLTGIPALTLPMGLDSNGIPLGLQLMSARNREDNIFALAFEIEQALQNKNRG